MQFAAKDTLTEEEVQSGLRAVIRGGMASTSMATLTGGPFLVAFALKLGASNLVIGLLAAIPPLAQLLQIPSIYLVERIRNRRAISMTASTGGRVFWLFIASIPLVFSRESGLTLLLVAILLNAAFTAVSNCSWNSWMPALVPQERLGAFFSRRMSMSVGLGIALSLAAPFFTVYMLKRLQLDLSLIIAFTILSQIINIAFLRIWGGFSDRFSNKSVLGVSGPLFMGCIIAFTFTAMPERHILTLPLLVLIDIFMGISTAGVTLASGNIGLKLAPKGQATAYLAANSLVNSLARVSPQFWVASSPTSLQHDNSP